MRSILVALLLLASTAADAANRVWITEFQQIRSDPLPIATLPAIVHQPPLTITNLSPVSSQPFNSLTRYIRIICEVQCSIKVGAGAAQTDMMLPATRPEYFGVPLRGTVSVIANP